MADFHKFTDNNLKVFYNNLLTHYQECMKRSPQPTIHEVYNEMYQATQYTVDSFHGSLYHLEANEKVRVYQAFNSIFYALPLYRDLQIHAQNNFIPNRPPINVNIVYNPPLYYRTNYNDTLLTWMLLSSMTHNCHHYPPVGSSGGNVHTHPSNNSSDNKSNKDTGQLIVALILIALIAAAAALAFIALFYMIHQFVNSVERIWYNEGWLKASLMLATSVAFGAASTIFSFTVASAPIIALAIAAGFNPVTILIISAVCLTVMGAGLACFVTSLIYDSIDERVNKDSIDPADSARFRLTVSEEHDLINKGIDPVKVKCAIVALRAEMSKELDNENTIPSFFSRHFGSGSKVQPLLEKVRSLRHGDISEVTVGDLSFNCRIPAAAPVNENNMYHYYNLYVQQHIPQGYDYVPSAPQQSELDHIIHGHEPSYV